MEVPMHPTSSFSRRQFLRRSAAAGAGVVAAVEIIPRRALAAPGQPGANDRIRVGYIGCGRRAHQIMDLPAEGQIVAAADVNLPRAEGVAKRSTSKSFKAHRDYRSLLDDKGIDAVVIASPDFWRAIHCIHACQAGKDIYAEKPLTLTIKEGRAIVNAVKRHDRVLQTGAQQRSMAANRVACELIRNGRIGKVHTVIGANYPSPWLLKLPGQPVPEGLDWDAWCGPTTPVPFHNDLYLPRAKPGWISIWPYSGGEMTGWGAHGLDQIQWALGADGGGPIAVSSSDGPYKPPVFDAPMDADRVDSLFKTKHKVTFLYPGGVTVKLDDGSGAGGTFIGERGKIVIRRDEFVCDPPELAKEPLPADAVRLDVSNDHMQNWFDCMKTRKDPISNAEVGHRSCTVCHLGNIARWLGRELKWDPEQEVFPDDDEANAYLDVERRKPYVLPEVV
jgi:predicted dehydrogenase